MFEVDRISGAVTTRGILDAENPGVDDGMVQITVMVRLAHNKISVC